MLSPNEQLKYRTPQALDLAFWPRALVFSTVYLQPEETLGWEEEGRKSTLISFSSQQKTQALKPNTGSTPVAAVQFVFL